MRSFTRFEISGLDQVPTEGPCIVATNHMSRLDTPLLMVSVPRQDVIALVADKYRFNPLFSMMVRVTGSIWINREIADFSAFRRALQFLKTGGVLGIAPEGTRSRVGGLIQAKTGVAFLADRANVPVIPVGISGSDVAMAEIRRLRRPTMHIHYGKPIILPPIDRNHREESLAYNTTEIMCQIAALLPEKHRGFYADNLRLKEILAEG